MKFLFLAAAAVIFIEAAKAYISVGAEVMGLPGRIFAILLFIGVQWHELQPIFLTGGKTNLIEDLTRIISGKSANIYPCDPEVLLDASMWAWAAYGVDFIAGINVWPLIVPNGGGMHWLDLLGLGALTRADFSLWNAVMVFACVFGMQWCISQYLKRGGKIPARFRGVA